MKKAIAFIILGMMASCSGSPNKADIWSSDSDTIRISLPDNPSTGYRWRLTGTDICDSAGFEYEQTVKPGDLEKNICGRGGTATYIIVARPDRRMFSFSSERTDTIEFTLSRGGEDPAETRKYVIGFR